MEQLEAKIIGTGYLGLWWGTIPLGFTPPTAASSLSAIRNRPMSATDGVPAPRYKGDPTVARVATEGWGIRVSGGT